MNTRAMLSRRNKFSERKFGRKLVERGFDASARPRRGTGRRTGWGAEDPALWDIQSNFTDATRVERIEELRVSFQS